MDESTCTIDGCDKPVRIKSRGWCSPHYSRWRDHGDPLGGGPDRPLVPQSTRACAIEGCSRLAQARGLCGSHYYRANTHGNATAGRTQEGAGLAFLESSIGVETDECVIWPYTCSSSGHGQVRVDGRTVLVNDLVCERMNGPRPSPKHSACHQPGHDPACMNHRHLQWAVGDRQHRVRAPRPICAIPGCGEPVMTLASGWCSRHYQRAKAHDGDPLAGRSSNGAALAYFEANLLVPTRGCKIWPFGTMLGGSPSSPKRYGRLWKDGRNNLVHVLVAEAVHGPRPGPIGQWDACHGCNDGLCWSFSCLRWDTRAGNMNDQIEHGTRNEGERNGHARLTESEVINIRARCAAGSPPAPLAAEFDVSERHIKAIASGYKWKYLDRPAP